ncbi:MAG: aminopeptidase [Patescibacteria group bacterium]|nr:aminopeptidase [Patescibacteria group bacterium]
MDSRYEKLAQVLVRHSTKVRKGDRVLLMTDVSTPHDMNLAVIQAVRDAGGVCLEPYIMDQRLQAAARIGCTARQLRVDAAAQLVRYLGAAVRIAIRGYMNPLEIGDVPPEDSQRYSREYLNIVMDEGVEGTRWVLTEWPTPGFAVLANMSTTGAEQFFFEAVFADYPAMTRAAQPLRHLMERTKQVRIVGPKRTDLTFSIEGVPVVPCIGKKNIPDGEMYTAPVLNSVNGVIEFNTVSITREGERFSGIGFEVKDGVIVREWCETGDSDRLSKRLDTDEGARRFGEFSLGLNWDVTRTIGDTLFDEKVGGSFHLTPGRSYDDAPNGNSSATHWDLVCDQREGFGGGDIYFDGRLVRKNGLFVPKVLANLNPRA